MIQRHRDGAPDDSAPKWNSPDFILVLSVTDLRFQTSWLIVTIILRCTHQRSSNATLESEWRTRLRHSWSPPAVRTSMYVWLSLLMSYYICLIVSIKMLHYVCLIVSINVILYMFDCLYPTCRWRPINGHGRPKTDLLLHIGMTRRRPPLILPVLRRELGGG